MAFKIIDEGFVSKRNVNSDTSVAAGPRCIMTDSGELVCTYMVQRALSINDFKPMIKRSKDKGKTWTEEGLLWPELKKEYSIFGSISRSSNGDCFFYGSRTKIDIPGESFWSEETQGLKQNQLVWSKSDDAGHTWTPLQLIPMPVAASAEAPGPMCITRKGTLLCCYAPYNNFDPVVKVQKNKIISLRSEDKGKSWKYNSMLKFAQSDGGAESWVVELTDSRLFGASWHMNLKTGSDYPNAYSISEDDGKTWMPTRSTSIEGQSCALMPLPDAKAAFIYNKRKLGEIGVYLAIVNLDNNNFNIEMNDIIWKAHKSDKVQHTQWTDFSFGEPSVIQTSNNELFAALWCTQPYGQGIYYLKLRF